MELMFGSIEAVLALTELQDGTQEMNEGDSPIVHLKCCTLFSLRQSAPSEPSIISCCRSEPSCVLVQNTSIKSSGSSLSENGGCIAMKLSEGSLFHCNFYLLLLVVVYQNETIFASSSVDNASDSRQCGAISAPCSSLNSALSHIIPSVYSNLLIDKRAVVSGEASTSDVTIKSLEQESDKGVLRLNCCIESKTGSLVACSSRVKMEFLTILFGNAFSSSRSSFVSLADVNLLIDDTIFAQEASGGGSEIELNCSIIEMSCGRLTIFDCTFAGLHFSSSCLAASREQYFSCAFLNFTDVISGVLMDFHDLAKLSMQPVRASNCSAQRSGLILRNCKDCQLQNIQMRGTQNGSSVIVFSSDGSGGHSNIQGNHLEFDDTRVSSESLVSVECQDSDVEMNFLAVSNTMFGDGCSVSVTSNDSASRSKHSSLQNITRDSLGPCCLAVSSLSLLLELKKCSNKMCASSYKKCCIAALTDLTDTCMFLCVFYGAASASELRTNDKRSEELCQWNGSMPERSWPSIRKEQHRVLWPCTTVHSKSERRRWLKRELITLEFLPCGFALQIDSSDGSIHNLQSYPLQSEEFAGETEFHTAIPASIITTAFEATEVSVKILFGRTEFQASTDSFILKTEENINQKEMKELLKEERLENQ
ncbi:uncharacterized protein MONOS_6066 [Monocercomonoides exilis]|uniref:uncharacterized protein n=1 Tax=Monocercomonoides exilis TaxID=2049356 RepID=UPI003559BB0D|nr:hypothetical protein MONOS_6066 [Monocercomonoides exilis]|eukprot:MONOS_6066.1-p1 / transcript=MONOS_6066.1 / gene=MONOS_6066 / organism=Monocercomonoides_exilis_PA203 / gene_product=unspecified product / transcript_product=unspecified product / location=Mono_scaffold00186:29349-31823(+) / protein_length=649 / sequence_SO=supercontig / SO=protein_coding / is_pseudo=false